jgi:hypothetical protein
MATEHFSAQESLQLIQSMISKTRRNISGQSNYFLLWGWCACLACIGQFLLASVFHYEKHYLVWLITIPCIIINLVWSARDKKKIKARTYVDENMEFLWQGVAFSFFVLSMIFIRTGFYYCYPFYILLYGLGAFVSGRILQFKPLLIGGIINWLLAITAVNSQG